MGGYGGQFVSDLSSPDNAYVLYPVDMENRIDFCLVTITVYNLGLWSMLGLESGMDLGLGLGLG